MNNRKAIILDLSPNGLAFVPIMEKLTAEIQKKFTNFVIETNKYNIIKRVDTKLINDVFLVGGKNEMNFAAELGLLFREKNLPARCLFIPACPYNSVPFNDVSIGFASALNWCISLGADILFLLKAERTQNAILEIEGDDAGWLSTAAAFYLREKSKNVFALLANENKKITKKASLIITNFNYEAKESARCIKINPAKLIDSKYIAKNDFKYCRFAAKAAVKFALKSDKQKTNILVANRLSRDKSKLTFEIVNLLESANTPRQLPKKIFLPNNLF